MGFVGCMKIEGKRWECRIRHRPHLSRQSCWGLFCDQVWVTIQAQSRKVKVQGDHKVRTGIWPACSGPDDRVKDEGSGLRLEDSALSGVTCNPFAILTSSFFWE